MFSFGSFQDSGVLLSNEKDSSEDSVEVESLKTAVEIDGHQNLIPELMFLDKEVNNGREIAGIKRNGNF